MTEIMIHNVTMKKEKIEQYKTDSGRRFKVRTITITSKDASDKIRIDRISLFTNLEEDEK